MTFRQVTPAEIGQVWKWVEAEPDVHQYDGTPSNMTDFVNAIVNNGVTLIGFHQGKKFIGVIGVKEQPKYTEIHGIHFVPEVRGQMVAFRALASIIAASDPKPVRIKWLADNLRMLHFVKKFTGHLLPSEVTVHKSGEPVPVMSAELTVNPRVTLA